MLSFLECCSIYNNADSYPYTDDSNYYNIMSMKEAYYVTASNVIVGRVNQTEL